MKLDHQMSTRLRNNIFLSWLWLEDENTPLWQWELCRSKASAWLMSWPVSCDCHSQHTCTRAQCALTRTITHSAHTRSLYFSITPPPLAYVTHTLSLCSYKCSSVVRARRCCLFNGPSVGQLLLWGGRCVGRRSQDLGGRAGAAGSDRWRGVRLHSFSSMRTTEPHFKQQGRNLLAPSSANTYAATHMLQHMHACVHTHICFFFFS